MYLFLSPTLRYIHKADRSHAASVGFVPRAVRNLLPLLVVGLCLLLAVAVVILAVLVVVLILVLILIHDEYTSFRA